MIIGGLLVNGLALQGDLLGSAITVLPTHSAALRLEDDYSGAWAMLAHAYLTPAFWLACFGIVVAWFCYMSQPHIPAWAAKRFSLLYRILVDKYGFDSFNDWFFVRGTRNLARFAYRIGDVKLVDDFMVNGSGRLISWLSSVTRRVQSGYLYHYALIMIVGLLLLMIWLAK